MSTARANSAQKSIQGRTAVRGPIAAGVSVLLPLPLVGAYDYRTGSVGPLVPGEFVLVPLGNREVLGVVWGPARGDAGSSKLRNVIKRIDAPPMSASLRDFVEWVADYTVSLPGSVLRMAMSVPGALEPSHPVRVYTLSEQDTRLRMTSARRRVLAVLSDGLPREARDLAQEAGVGTSVVRGLSNAGALAMVTSSPPSSFARPDWRRCGLKLSPDQARAANTLVAQASAGEFAVTLIDGVTGSGKTEVYFEAVAAVLSQDKQALVLLPEIALTPQWLGRFTDRFGVAPAVWHSDLTQAQRRVVWRAVASGEVRVLVGARSALFLPFTELGLIIVDEEHEGAYKQQDGVTYHARDMAVVRASLGAHLVILASATPSLETVVNVERGKFRSVRLPTRHSGSTMPQVSMIDLRAEPPPRGRFLSPILCQAVTETLEAGQQVLLYLNRRGYAPLTLCRACGHRLRCPHCTTWLVEHRFRRQLMCHHCGHMESSPEACPACSTEASLVACGPGVERIGEEVEGLFPNAAVGIMTSDTVRGPEAAAALLREVTDHRIDLLIGTQMIAKGHHFPLLTLVGIVDADLGLGGGDLRAAERTYQLLHQVGGRSGRGQQPGRVLVQTYAPEHRVMKALRSGERDQFLELEAEARRSGRWPPFGRLAAIVVSGRDAAIVERTAALLGRYAPRGRNIRVLGPAPAPLAILRGRHRIRLLVKAEPNVRLQVYLKDWLNQVKAPSGVRIHVDIDPQGFL